MSTSCTSTSTCAGCDEDGGADLTKDMSTSTISRTATCASCGKDGGPGGLKSCNACKMVKFCGRTCQVDYWPKHKKECKQRAAELLEEALFQMPPPYDDCPICFLRYPLDNIEHQYQACCGKTVCGGCLYAVMQDHTTRSLCPFCRAHINVSDAEVVALHEKRAKAGDAAAVFQLAAFYNRGRKGLPQDDKKAMEHWIRAAKLGHRLAWHNVGNAYRVGSHGMEANEKKAIHYYQLSAMRGDVHARYNLAMYETLAGKLERAVRHYRIAAAAGCDDSLEMIRRHFFNGDATKEDFESALRTHKEAKDEMRSHRRDVAAAEW